MSSATFVEDLTVELYIMILFWHLTKYEHTHVALVLCPFALKPFANLHHFLICALLLGLRPSGWLYTNMLPKVYKVHGTEQNWKAAHSHTISVTVHSLFISKSLDLFGFKSFLFYLKSPQWHTEGGEKNP